MASVSKFGSYRTMTAYESATAWAAKRKAAREKFEAQQTEIDPGTGSQSANGKWKLELARFEREDQALSLYDSLRSDGYPARILPLSAGGRHEYSVRLAGFASEAGALALGERLKEAHPSLNPRATRR